MFLEANIFLILLIINSICIPVIKSHPLDPLSASEIFDTSRIILGYTGKPESYYQFNWISLQEPPKALILPYFLRNNDPPDLLFQRKSFTVLVERSTGSVYEVVVNLKTKGVERMQRIYKVQPQFTPEELTASQQIALKDSRVLALCKAAGYPDPALCSSDPWSMGYIGDKPQYQGKRLAQMYFYGRNFKEDNQYAHPLDFIAIVDLTTKTVIEIQQLPTHDNFDASNKQGNTVPKKEANYDFTLQGGPSPLRTDDKPIIVTSPEGASFKVTGNLVKWQKWQFRIGFNGREGLVLYLINYNDNGNVRPVMYRASASEMYIPYGDPRPPYYMKSVFDEGQYGIGFLANSQTYGQDVIATSCYWDANLNTESGRITTLKNVVSLREEDVGILWKHVDFKTGKSVTTRSHRLTASFIATVGNYDYNFQWMFYQDGTIQMDVQLTGILSTNLLASDATSTGGYGTIVANQINAQYHQHFIIFRMDMEIDGNSNSVYTNDVVPLPDPTGSPSNPYGQGFTTKRTVLSTASDGKTNISPFSSRTWLIENPGKIHKYTKKPVTWKLVPNNSAPPMMKPDSPLRLAGKFIDHDVWVTRFKDDQFFAGGLYLNDSGLNQWVNDNPTASIVNTDIVLWHYVGLTHIPRVEDYPIMPGEVTSFMLKPYNFFDQNPGLDVKPPPPIPINP